MDLVTAALNDPRHSLNSLKDRFSEFFSIRRQREAVVAKAKAKLAEHSSWAAIHRDALTLLLTGSAPTEQNAAAAAVAPVTMAQLYTDARYIGGIGGSVSYNFRIQLNVVILY